MQGFVRFVPEVEIVDHNFIFFGALDKFEETMWRWNLRPATNLTTSFRHLWAEIFMFTCTQISNYEVTFKTMFYIFVWFCMTIWSFECLNIAIYFRMLLFCFIMTVWLRYAFVLLWLCLQMCTVMSTIVMIVDIYIYNLNWL